MKGVTDQLRQTVVDVARGDRRPDCDITHKILLYGSHRLHFMQAWHTALGCKHLFFSSKQMRFKCVSSVPTPAKLSYTQIRTVSPITWVHRPCLRAFHETWCQNDLLIGLQPNKNKQTHKNIKTEKKSFKTIAWLINTTSTNILSGVCAAEKNSFVRHSYNASTREMNRRA